jgi:hypothetical protein
MSDKSEFERLIIRDILAKERLEGLPMIWLKSKLEQILDGADPRAVFARQGREVQKTKTIVERAQLAIKVGQEKLKGSSVLEAKTIVSQSEGVSYDSVDTAWKQYGKFVNETLPRESSE